MNVCSIEFLFSLFLVSGLCSCLNNYKAKQLLLSLLSLGFLFSNIPNFGTGLVLFAFLCLGWLVSVLLIRYPNRNLYATYLCGSIVFFIYINQYVFLEWFFDKDLLNRSVVIAGISYMLFKQIHVATDTLQGQIVEVKFWDYLNYQINLFTLLSGPIQRYQDFVRGWSKLAPHEDSLGATAISFYRIFIGIIQLAGIAAISLAVYEKLVDPFDASIGASRQSIGVAFLALVAILYIYPAYIYFNFMGYCNIVIGSSALFGMQLPENFNSPFMSRNLIDFWGRWHITLGHWIRDYLFTPLYKSFVSKYPARSIALSYLAYFIAFLLAGLWHGSTFNFLVFGCLHGLGVSLAKYWEQLIIKRQGRSGLRRYLGSRFNRVIATFVTFHYVCFTFIFFPADLHNFDRVIRSLFYCWQ